MSRISQQLADAINDQIGLEIQSFYVYHTMANWLESLNWHMASKYYYEQAQEEFTHSQKFTDFLIDLGIDVKTHDLKAPPAKYENVKAALVAVLEHEKLVTDKIHALYKMAQSNGDLAAYPILLWFINEQIEEEALATEVVERYGHFRENDLMWDHRMKKKDLGITE